MERRKFELKDQYSIEELLALMAFLRSDRGCPWDRQQTHESIKKNLLEEAYEAIDAIDSGRADRICDELGDVLLQVVFHAQMAAEAGTFTFDQVITGICRKLISRHTHLFAGPEEELVAAGSAEEVLDLWEENKKKEKGLRSQSQVLEDVPLSLPALQRSYKVQDKAAKLGFDWPDKQGPLAKVKEELAEVLLADQELAGGTGTSRELALEFGDFLFAAVNLARHLGVQPEIALKQATDKFIRRFVALEEAACAADQLLTDLSLEELDGYWDTIKEEENKHEIR